MRCLRCGHDNGQTPHLQPVMLKSAIGAPGDTVAEPEPIYARWACEKCGRFHFPDGTLYSNPFTTIQET